VVSLPNASTARELRKRVPLEGQAKGFTTVPDGIEDITYSISIDHALLDVLAQKAAGNKSQKSKDGPVTVQIVSRKKRSQHS
jgi:hypothetical protein